MAGMPYAGPAASSGTDIVDLDDVNVAVMAKCFWETELAVINGARSVGYGAAPKGFRVNRNIVIEGVHYQFETVTTAGTTTMAFEVNGVDQAAAAGSIAQGVGNQTINGLSISVPAGQRVAVEITNAGTSGYGRGLWVAVWGRYV